MNSLTLKSPSKINLFLKITGKRKDGYHLMVTLFHRLSLSDEIKLTKRKDRSFRLRISDKKVPTGKKNLIRKAYDELAREVPNLPGVDVVLKKNIPMGAGLGGGSSNAATFLLGMNQLYHLKLSRAKLVKLGKRLGADVPFFLYEARLALGRGRGDEITPKPFKQKLWFILVLSKQGLSTKKVFEKLHFKRSRSILTKIEQTARLLPNILRAKDLRQLPVFLANDLEKPAFHLRPSLKKVITNLKAKGAAASGMTGSGATVFAVLSSKAQAQNIAQGLSRDLPTKKIVVCHTY